MNKLTCLVFTIISTLSFCQNKLFYIEIPNKNNIPSVENNTGKLFLKHTDNHVTNIFSKYTIYKFEKAFPTSVTPFLQNIYIIETDKGEIINELKNYKNYFPLVRETYVPQVLYTPNDYNYPAGSSNPHKNLDLINIKDAWDYTHGDPNIKIGISDTPIRLTHEDLVGKVTSLVSYTYSDSHGTAVASHAAANTDNGLGLPGTGFNSTVLYNYIGINKLLELSQNGARIVNASWLSTCSYDNIEQAVIDEIHKNGTVIIAAAGNGGTCGGPFNYVYPASYNHVIAISSVGYEDVGYMYNNLPVGWRDRVEQIIGDPSTTHQTNDLVDLSVAGFNVLGATAVNDSSYGGAWGTSLSAPQVSGIVALLFSVNNCLNTNEVESILKLTSFNTESIHENLPYLGKIGAGRIEAGKATKMAWQMNPNNGGEIIISDRNFDRWHFELTNSPQKVRIKNQSFTNNSDITIKAKDYIVFDENVLIQPGSDKANSFYIGDDTCFNFSASNKNINAQNNKQAQNNLIIKKSQAELYPNPVEKNLFIKSNNYLKDDTILITIYDLSGREIMKDKVSYSKFEHLGIDLTSLTQGQYLIELVFPNKEKTIQKIIKK
ncbi:MAG: S8 family serine peptidase [Candidatus Chryseobacterium colombiense]|nr:S8 family serine peptidase [Chryseobacterium sp.]WEK70118.1 MAG: S8 family serine peptidase [Chryseobacterium sp.]